MSQRNPPVEKTILRTMESDVKPPEHGSGVSYWTIYGGVGGKVKDISGSPIGGATVYAWEDSSYIGSKSSYSDGRYHFQQIMGEKDSNGNYYGVNPSYRYSVYADHRDYRGQWRHGTWRRGMEDMPVWVNFSLEREEESPTW